MNFKVLKTVSGKVRVKYNCPHCNDSLESELAEAGSSDTCPACQKQFVVPGEAKRKEFETHLRQQLEAKKEAERQKLAEAERKRAEVAAMAAQRQAELEAEQNTAKANQSLALSYQPPASRPAAPLFIAPQYRAIEFYLGILQVFGWLCIVAFGLGLVLMMWTSLVAAGKTGDHPMLIFLTGAGMVSLATLPPALMFFVGAQFMQLALDARQDLAQIVALQQSIVEHQRQSAQ